MGKSYNNQIRLTEMFTGSHPLLQQAYSPMTIRFFILQTHYRSTLDFSNEALQAAEKGLKRLWEAYDLLKKLEVPEAALLNGAPATVPVNRTPAPAADPELDNKVRQLLLGLDEFMNDDFNTAKVLANIFELVPIVNSLKSGHVQPDALSPATIAIMKKYFTDYLENILGLKGEFAGEDQKLKGVVDLLIDIRRDARTRKDYATSDKIRNQLLGLGIVLKDEKDGGVSYTFA
jgi:cysteinyl-tRNA synthetase